MEALGERGAGRKQTALSQEVSKGSSVEGGDSVRESTQNSEAPGTSKGVGCNTPETRSKRGDPGNWSQRDREPWRKGCPPELAMEEGSHSQAFSCMCTCVRKHVHTCVCKYPNPSLLPPSSLLLLPPMHQIQMEIKGDGSLGDVVFRGSLQVQGWSGDRPNQEDASQDRLAGWPRLSSMSVERDQQTLRPSSPTAATFSTSKAARASAAPGGSAGTSASACCSPGSSCSSVSSRV